MTHDESEDMSRYSEPGRVDSEVAAILRAGSAQQLLDILGVQGIEFDEPGNGLEPEAEAASPGHFAAADVVLAHRLSETGPKDAAEGRDILHRPDVLALLRAAWTLEHPTDDILRRASASAGEEAEVLRELLLTCHTRSCPRCRQTLEAGQTELQRLLAGMADVEDVAHTWWLLESAGSGSVLVRGPAAESASRKIIVSDDAYQELHGRARQDRDRSPRLEISLEDDGSSIAARLVVAAEVSPNVRRIEVIANTETGPITIPLNPDETGIVFIGSVVLETSIEEVIPPLGLRVVHND